jgi:2'-5' RNA ligase
MALESRTNPISLHTRKPGDGTHFFFALKPDEKARVEIAQVRERFLKTHRLIGAAVDSDDFHLTLVDMGRPERLKQPLEDALFAAAEAVHINGFEVSLDSAMRLSAARDGNFPFVLCADNMSAASALALRRAIAEAQQRHGLQVLGISNYLPHITLLRGGVMDSIQMQIPPISWSPHEFVLIRSFFGQSRHEVIGRWPLLVSGRQLVEFEWPDEFDLPVDE